VIGSEPVLEARAEQFVGGNADDRVMACEQAGASDQAITSTMIAKESATVGGTRKALSQLPVGVGA
jgi:hypothetical protein